jgi:hypothetical protein
VAILSAQLRYALHLGLPLHGTIARNLAVANATEVVANATAKAAANGPVIAGAKYSVRCAL